MYYNNILATKISQFTVCSVHRYFFQFLRGHFCTATSIIHTEKFFYFCSSRPPMKISCLKYFRTWEHGYTLLKGGGKLVHSHYCFTGSLT